MNPAVDEWFANYKGPKREAMQQVRKVLLESDARLTEEIKWNAPTFVYKGNLMTFNPRATKCVSLIFHTGAKIPGQHPKLEGDGKEARSMRIDEGEVERLKDDLGHIVKAWCDWKDQAGGE
jgi:hypothetical protein